MQGKFDYTTLWIWGSLTFYLRRADSSLQAISVHDSESANFLKLSPHLYKTGKAFESLGFCFTKEQSLTSAPCVVAAIPIPNFFCF